MKDAPDPAPPAPTPPAAPRRRRPLSTRRKAAFGLFVLGFLLGGTEVFFRIREVVRAGRKPRLPLMFDAYRGTRLIPGARYAAKTRAAINEEGLRGAEITKEKPAGVVRIACVGGSTTFGLYDTSDETTWPAQLARSLQGARSPVQVLNCGVPGWTLRQNLTDLQLRIFDLSPDVVVCYQGYNDLMSNVDPRYWADSKADDPAALYHPLDSSDGLLEKSAFVRFLEARFLVTRITVSKVDRVDPEGLAAYERNLRRLARLCKERGIRLLLCTQPHCYRETLEASRAAGVPDLEEWYELFPLTYPRLIEGMNAYNAATIAVGAECGVPVLDLAAQVPPDVGLYRTPIHHSDEGEARIANLVRGALLEHHLLEGAP